jgi:light-regulated signal transduction histidine kinase (bacteriophytochrome)
MLSLSPVRNSTDVAIVLFDDSIGHGKTEAGPLIHLFGGKARTAFNGFAGFESEVAAGLSPGILKAMGGENRDFEAYCFRLANDLRSPLNGINITCEALVMLFGDQFNDECKKFLEYMQEEVQRMNRLIDGVMTFSKHSC